ncbi:peroxiredoxin [Endozoicomonas ascidiicola]|uniref:peroxiredoxin n=1 Tax=Endozoicomonas ascidiicola TaxID=1698521 RepID=UPI000829F5D9|nr:peroxiredoxin [Endozoicomonas ascidiicola]
MSVTLGHPVPDFTAEATSNTTVKLSELKDQKVVLFFYPKDNTPGCTSEGQAFRDLYEQFQASDTLIFGVSKDGMKAHENFRAKHDFPFELISDPDEELCKLFDVIKLKKLYGKEYMGIERSTFLIDSNGTLQHEWRKVRIKGHVEDVLQAAQMVDTQAIEAEVAESSSESKDEDE